MLVVYKTLGTSIWIIQLRHLPQREERGLVVSSLLKNLILMYNLKSEALSNVLLGPSCGDARNIADAVRLVQEAINPNIFPRHP